jgi:hypothetical protein
MVPSSSTISETSADVAINAPADAASMAARESLGAENRVGGDELNASITEGSLSL